MTNPACLAPSAPAEPQRLAIVRRGPVGLLLRDEPRKRRRRRVTDTLGGQRLAVGPPSEVLLEVAFPPTLDVALLAHKGARRRRYGVEG